MKLSEALILRKDIQSRLDEMENRLCACALTQEGESPAEDPAALLAELESLTSQHCELCARINLTNSRTMTEGQSLTAIAARQGRAVSSVSRSLRGARDKLYRFTEEAGRIGQLCSAARQQRL